MEFSHEKLVVYHRAIEFVAWSQPLIESLPATVSARQQLERSSTSIPLNIAEGNVKASRRDRARFWQIALGSTVESAAALDVLVARKLKSPKEVTSEKRLLHEVVSMLMTLLKQLGTTVAEPGGEYRVQAEGVSEQKQDEDEDEDEDEDPRTKRPLS